ncbi:hypothetical protein YT1_3384 [Rhodococcus ruber]|nr:hypothetical protein YT1_3384 [Rhodococcus ruber]
MRRRGWYGRPLVPARRRERNRMSYLLYDFLLPYLGHEAASYWAHLLVVAPI